jgi:hypothetical protein
MTRFIINTLVISIAVAAITAAKSPPAHMHPRALGVEYRSIWEGRFITEASVASGSHLQHAMLSYEPLPFIQVSLGAGAASFSVARYGGIEFNGGYNFSPAGGLWLYSPAFVEQRLRISGGADLSYFHSSEEHIVYRGYMAAPWLGALFHAHTLVDIEAGVRGHVLVGVMENTQDSTEDSFSNTERARGFVSVTLAARNGAYATLDLDASPEIMNTRWSDGLTEARIGITVGVVLKETTHISSLGELNDTYFPNTDEAREKQRRMKEEL